MIKTYHNFFEEEQLQTIHSYLQNPKWISQKSLPWDVDFGMYDVSHLSFFNTELFDYINFKLDSDFKLEKVYFNGQDYGQNGGWHPDNEK